MNFFKSENKEVISKIDVKKLTEFQLKHDMQIIRGADYLYECYIDKKVYEVSLTPLGAMWFGYLKFKELQK